MNESQQLRESMWDLVYGLLSEEESQALIARIKSDPEAARLYSEVRLQADLVGQAARVEDSPVVMTPDSAVNPAPAKRAKPSAARGRSSAAGNSFGESHRGGAWLAGMAMIALTALLAVGFFWPRPNWRQLSSSFVSIDVMGQRSLPAGLTNQVALRTYLVSSAGEPTDGTPADVDLRLMDRAGTERFHKAVRTNDIGQAIVEIPGDALEPGVRMEVAAAAPASDFAAKLDDREAAGMSGVKAKQQSSLAVNLSVQPEPQMAYFLLAEPNLEAGKVVPFSLWNFSAFGAKPSSPETSQAAIGSVEGLVRAEPQANSKDGFINGTLQMPAGEKAEAQLSQRANKANQRQFVKETESRSDLGAGQPINVTIPQQLAGKQITIAARNRGVTIATASAPESATHPANGLSKESQQSGGQFSLALPPEADGLIEVDVFDRSSSETEPAQRQFAYRQPLRRLQIELPLIQERFATGQEVELTLRCTDENGKPAADTRLGVRVWNERMIQESGEQPVLLADAVQSGAVESLREVALQEQRAQTGQRNLAELDRLASRDAAPADDKRQRAEAQPPASEPISMDEPIELASNRDEVRTAFRQAFAQAEGQRQHAIEIIGGAAIFGGIAVLLLMGMLAVLRMAVGLRTMSPALIAALASVLIGLGWIGWLPQPHFRQIAMAPAAPAPEVQRASGATKSAPETETAAAPAVPALVGGEALAGRTKLADEALGAVEPAVVKPKGEPAAAVTLRQNVAAAKRSSAPG
ncbi:MAG TPA: hypothetical protein VKH44_06570, partial [Pirellulaceae bacterium]|nr:hypothetical protein [Pirellulaceae bacterium]